MLVLSVCATCSLSVHSETSNCLSDDSHMKTIILSIFLKELDKISSYDNFSET